ncbi:MAG: hypothetical protein SLAVMIC_00268 [uncultured marine phage]|uniref:Uncharacterized protein n=1 Tax=uncultured marine phage TaxID=707152 RepID=A0A8D9FQ32_9VIRU|nr:MAG: hypothetical protein SLAVMIC_00268 [uncultured marine phage]
MIRFNQYKGEELDKIPIDYGRQILKLNWSMSSFCMCEYIYQNDNGDLFYVNGVLQYTAPIKLYKDESDDNKDNDYYHLAIVIPIVSREALVNYLTDKGIMRDLFDDGDDCYIMKMDAPMYKHDDGRISYSMHPVVDEKEVSRKIDSELKDFDFKAVKVLKLKDVDSITHPTHYDISGLSTYGLDEDPNFIFIDDEHKDQIRNFCK